MSNTEPWMGPLPAAPGCDCHICRSDESHDEQDRRVIDTVLKHGWHVIMVAEGAGCDHPEHQNHSDADHDEAPAFAYTIGLGHCRPPGTSDIGLGPPPHAPVPQRHR